MALADILGVPRSFIKPFAAEEEDNELIVNNIQNPVHLALPPLANVSLFLRLFINELFLGSFDVFYIIPCF